MGDELRLKLGPLAAIRHGRAWEGVGQILRLVDGEVALEMRTPSCPVEITEGCVVCGVLLAKTESWLWVV